MKSSALAAVRAGLVSIPTALTLVWIVVMIIERLNGQFAGEIPSWILLLIAFVAPLMGIVVHTVAYRWFLARDRER